MINAGVWKGAGRKKPRKGIGVFGRIIRCEMAKGGGGGVRNQFG